MRPMIDYHVFHADDGDDVSVRWHGGATFNVYVGDLEVDVFTIYGDHKGNPPSLPVARAEVAKWLVENSDG